MTNEEFIAFIELLNHVFDSDPPPLAGDGLGLLVNFADRQAAARGYPHWMAALHAAWTERSQE